MIQRPTIDRLNELIRGMLLSPQHPLTTGLGRQGAAQQLDPLAIHQLLLTQQEGHRRRRVSLAQAVIGRRQR